MAVIYLIRHGQASFTSNNYDQLSTLGVKQSNLLGKALKERAFKADHIVAGTMMRHAQTAEECITHFSEKTLEPTDDRWNEYNHEVLLKSQLSKIGRFNSIKEFVMAQPHPMRAFQDLLNDAIADWMKGRTEHPISWTAYQNSSWEALHGLSAKLNKGEHAIVFTSGGPISSIVMRLLDLPAEKFMYLQNRLVNTSITKILVGKSGLSLSTFNEHGHLEHDDKLITYR